MEDYELIGSMLEALLKTDYLFTYNFLISELHISKTKLSGMKHGKDFCIHYYLQTFSFVMELIQLTIFAAQLLIQIKIVLSKHRDLVISTVPHEKHGTTAPDKWVKILEWED